MVADLPPEETVRCWGLTTSQWPMMSAVLHGVIRDVREGRNQRG